MKEVCILVAIVLACALPATAHHNYRLNFDDSKEIALDGVVTEISWANPHITIYLDVPTDSGDVISWVIPTAAPNVARRNGLTDAVLEAGDQIYIVGWPARDESLQMRARMVKVSDGDEYLLHPTGDRRGRNRGESD